MRLTGRQVLQGERLPWWYGLAYYEFCRDEQVAYPIPLNLIVRWARDLHWLLQRGKKGKLDAAYRRGLEEGFANGIDFMARETLKRLPSREDP